MMHLGLTPLQLEERRGFIGASDSGDIVTGAWRRLWNVKTARAEAEDLWDIIVRDGNRYVLKHLTRERLELARLMGHCTEPLNNFWYEQQTGRKVEHVQELRRHPSLSYLACHLDGETTTQDGHPASFQTKHVSKTGDQHVLKYTAQCTHEALCCGYDWWVMSTFVGTNKWELTEQQVDPFFAIDYLAKCGEFWRYVELDQEPPEVPPLAVPQPRKLRIVQLEDDFESEWPNWGPPMMGELDSWARTLPAFKAHQAATDKVKELLPEDVGTVTRGRLKVARDRSGAVRISLKKDEARD